MTASAFLLFILTAGVPAPLFALPMPDERTCWMNARSFGELLNDKTGVACFDVERQVLHLFPRGGLPHAPDERVD